MIRDDLFSAIHEIPCVDVCNHLQADALCAQNLGRLMLDPSVCYALRSAGVEEALLWPGGDEHSAGAFTPYAGLCKVWPGMANTGAAWILRTIFRELYHFDEHLTMDSIGRLEQSFADHTVQGDWGLQVLKRGGVERLLSTAVPASTPKENAAGLRPLAEGQAPPMGPQEGQTWAAWLRSAGESGQADICSLDDLQGWHESLYGGQDLSQVPAATVRLATASNFIPVPAGQIDAIIQRAREGGALSVLEEAALQSAAIRCLCRALRGKVRVVQLHVGLARIHAGPHLIERVHPHFASGLAHLLGEFSDLHFMIINAHESIEPTLCSLTRAYSNISLAGGEWQLTSPAVLHSVWHRRLDRVPACRLCGLTTGSTSADWVYGRLQLTRRVLAAVLTEKVDRGFYSTIQAIDIAQQLLLDTPGELLLPGEDL
jgi:hypothetical protein